MSLPSSGQISINDIRNELQTSNGSLGTLSEVAGITNFGNQIAISNFYGYSAYSLVYSGLSAGSPCNSAIYNIYINAGNSYYYASDNGGSTFTLATDISVYYYAYSYYDDRFDAYIYNEYETNNVVFNLLLSFISDCPPS